MIKLQLKEGSDGLRVREAPETGKPIGQINSGDEIESLESLKVTREKLAGDKEWIHLKTSEGIEGYTAAWFLEIVPGQSFAEDQVQDEEPLMVRPTVRFLRLRDTPSVGSQVALVSIDDLLTSMEDAEETRAKVGVEGQWLQVKTDDGIEAYTAAWYVEIEAAATTDESTSEPPSRAGRAAESDNVGTTLEDADKSGAEPAATAEKIAVKSTVRALRLRDAPVSGNQVVIVGTDDVLISLEDAETTRAKLGVDGEWIKVRTIYDLEGYTAAWFLEEYDGPIPEPTQAPDVRSILGMNLDIDHPHGKPSTQQLHRLGWIRIKFNVSYDPRKQGNARYGNTDVDYTYSRYIDAIRQYSGGGLKILMVLTHQAFGEGAGYYWPTMTTPQWRDLTGKYADMARRIASKFAGSGLISAYQIWNEQDTKPEHARAAVPIPASDYGHLLSETIKAIRSVDQSTAIITGGHVGGPDAGGDYARKTIAAMPGGIRPDGIAFHPYGRGPRGHQFSNFGAISESIQKYSAVMPGKPVWITEWGVLNAQGRNDLAPNVTDYATKFLNICNNDYSGRVAAAIWYAWADGMDNGYGFVNSDGSEKDHLYAALAK